MRHRLLGESIGDLGGVRIAYLAFQHAHQQHPEPAPPGLTPEQELFIAWGQFRGDETRPETQRRMVQGDPHPVARFRVIGPLSNLPAFQQAFACKRDIADGAAGGEAVRRVVAELRVFYSIDAPAHLVQV